MAAAASGLPVGSPRCALLENKQQLPAKEVRQRLSRLRGRIREAASKVKDEAVREQLQQFEKVTKSWWPGSVPLLHIV